MRAFVDRLKQYIKNFFRQKIEKIVIQVFAFLLSAFLAFLGIRQGCYDDKALSEDVFLQYQGDLAELNGYKRASHDSLQVKYPSGMLYSL